LAQAILAQAIGRTNSETFSVAFTH